LVWNSVRLTLRAPSKRREAVIDETIWSIRRLRIGVCWSFDVEISTTDVVDCFVVDHECAVGMFQGGVRGEQWWVLGGPEARLKRGPL